MLITLVGNVAKITYQLHGESAATDAMNTLLHLVEEQTMTLQRLETAIARLANAPFELGLAHLRDANAPTRTDSERNNYLGMAREAFKAGAYSSSEFRVRGLSALLCSLCWAEANKLADAARWAADAFQICIKGLDSLAFAKEPLPPPLTGWKRIKSLWSEPEIDQDVRQTWLQNHYSHLESLQLIAQFSARVANALDEDTTKCRDLLIYPHGAFVNQPSDAHVEHPRVFDVYNAEPLPVGTASLLLTRAIWRRWWPDNSDGSFELNFDVIASGEFSASELGLTTLHGTHGWRPGWMWHSSERQDNSWIGPRHPFDSVRAGIVTSGITDRVMVTDKTVPVIFDTTGVPPQEVAFISLVGTARGSWLPFSWTRGDDYLSSAPPPLTSEDNDYDDRPSWPDGDPFRYG